MSLFKQIQKDQLAARKAKDKVKTSLLTTLMGELLTDATGCAGKSVPLSTISDSAVIAKVKKFIKSLDEVAAMYPFQSEGQTAALVEISILKEYIPKQLTKDELTSILKDCGATNMGGAMAFLKKNYDGLYDGRAASTIAKSLF